MEKTPVGCRAAVRWLCHFCCSSLAAPAMSPAMWERRSTARRTNIRRCGAETTSALQPGRWAVAVPAIR